MEISQLNSAMQTGALTGTSNVNGITNQSPPPPPPQQDALSEYMAESGSDEDVKAFMQSIMDMEASGEFDAQSLAANAPATMQAFAGENGINLESFFQQKHDQQSARQSAATDMPPPPPGNSQTQTYASNEQLGSASASLMDRLTSSIGINTTA